MAESSWQTQTQKQKQKQHSSQLDAKGSKSLSLYVLTYNCARRPVNVGWLAESLFGDLSKRVEPVALGGKSGAVDESTTAAAAATADVGGGGGVGGDDDAAEYDNLIDSLPDILLISLQELAPLGPAFLGGWYWLGEGKRGNLVKKTEEKKSGGGYLPAVIDAVREGARKWVQRHGARRSPGAGRGDDSDLYELMIVRNVGMVGVLVFVKKGRGEDMNWSDVTEREDGNDRCDRKNEKRRVRVTDLWEAGVGCGVYGRVGNKGAVAVKMGIDVFDPIEAGDGYELGDEDEEGNNVRIDRKRKRKRGFSGTKRRHTQLCIVSAHLAPHEHAVERRNRDWEEVVRGLVFTRVEVSSSKGSMASGLGRGNDTEALQTRTSWLGFPSKGLKEDKFDDELEVTAKDGGNAENIDDEGHENKDDDKMPLLASQSKNSKTTAHQDSDRTYENSSRDGTTTDRSKKTANANSATKHESTVTSHHGIYAPGTHLIIAGDLNYRTAMKRPSSVASSTSSSVKPLNVSRASSKSARLSTQLSAKALLANDQLTQQRRAGKTMHGLEEAEIRFGPTYKLLQPRKQSRKVTDGARGDTSQGGGEEEEEEEEEEEDDDKDEDIVQVRWDLDDDIVKNTTETPNPTSNLRSSPVSQPTNNNHNPQSTPDQQAATLHYTATRSPSWCDRILFSPGVRARPHGYRALPSNKRHPTDDAQSHDKSGNTSTPNPSSDHLPVCLLADIDLGSDDGNDNDNDNYPATKSNPRPSSSSSSSSAQVLSFAELQSCPPFPLHRNWRARRTRARAYEIVVGVVVVGAEVAVISVMTAAVPVAVAMAVLMRKTGLKARTMVLVGVLLLLGVVALWGVVGFGDLW